MKLLAKRKTARRIAATALLIVGGSFSAANAYVLNFDSVPSGSTANDAAIGLGLSFDYAFYGPLQDEYGDDIAGSERYQIDSTAPWVTVSDPQLLGYGLAPSGSNALDAIDQGVLITFATPQNLLSFSATLDNSTFGFPGGFDIVFQDLGGAALYSLLTQQSIPGYVASTTTLLSGVASIYLPSGAFYDDITIATAPVPLPAALPLLLTGLAGLSSLARRRRMHDRQVRRASMA